MQDESYRESLPSIAAAFQKHINTHDRPISNSTDIMEAIYVTYSELEDRDPEDIRQGFCALEEHLEKLSLDDNNAVFSLICHLCISYERKAFLDGLRFGAYLMQDLQEK
jgi:hypothetical protein